MNIIIRCPRCGEVHNDVTPMLLQRPIAPPHSPFVGTHWLPCPTNGDPIIVEGGNDARPGNEVIQEAGGG